MARRKTKKRSTGRRGRVGGLVPKKYQSGTNMALGVGAGVLLARLVPSMITKVMPSAKPVVVNAIQAGVGVFIASSFKNPIVKSAGVGVAAMGMVDMMSNLKILPGADAVGADEIVLALDDMGYQANNVLAGNYTGLTFADNTLAGMHMQGLV